MFPAVDIRLSGGNVTANVQSEVRSKNEGCKPEAREAFSIKSKTFCNKNHRNRKWYTAKKKGFSQSISSIKKYGYHSSQVSPHFIAKTESIFTGNRSNLFNKFGSYQKYRVVIMNHIL